MPKGPRGEKRPADVIGGAVKVMRIATGEESEDAQVPEARSRQEAAAVPLHVQQADGKESSEPVKAAADARWKKTRS